MRFDRTFALARRVVQQIMRDRRTIALFLFGPMLMIALGALLMRSEAGAVSLGIVNEDEGTTIMLLGSVNIGQRITDQISQDEAINAVMLEPEEVDSALRDGTVRGVITFPPDFSAHFAETRRAALPLKLEGSNPTQSMTLTAQVMRSAMRAMAGLSAFSGMTDSDELPLTIETTYLYGGDEYDMLDFFAPVYIALIVFFFVFLLTTVSFLRERSQGTIERLMATPVNRFEIVTGYMLGFLIFALIEAGLLLLFTVVVIQIHYAGNLVNVFLIEALLVIVAVNLGIFLSTFARNEFQVLQFIPLVIFPMVLLSGMLWPLEDLPGALQVVACILPLTHANTALRSIMIKGWGLAEVLPQLAALIVTAGAMLTLAAATMRREVA